MTRIYMSARGWGTWYCRSRGTRAPAAATRRDRQSLFPALLQSRAPVTSLHSQTCARSLPPPYTPFPWPAPCCVHVCLCVCVALVFLDACSWQLSRLPLHTLCKIQPSKFMYVWKHKSELSRPHRHTRTRVHKHAHAHMSAWHKHMQTHTHGFMTQHTDVQCRAHTIAGDTAVSDAMRSGTSTSVPRLQLPYESKNGGSSSITLALTVVPYACVSKRCE
jgi:hypothetical protein